MSPARDFAAALLDPAAATPPGLRAWNGSDPGRRFDVHRNNVTASLVAALAESFPVCRALVGEDFFAAMAREFVRAAPPASPVLLDYGQDFAGFIEGFAPAASLAYLADMARLERARIEAFNAADADALGPADFADGLASPETLMRRRARVHPSLRLLRRSRCVLGLWRAHAPGGEAALAMALERAAAPEREDLLVLRPAMDVQALVLPTGGAATLAALQAGATLGDALAAGADQPGFDLAAVLAVLIHHGALAALHD